MKKARLKAFSICPCGFPALKLAVPLGTEYEIRRSLEVPFTWICGGCGDIKRGVSCVYVWRAGTDGGYLPTELFEIEEVAA